MSNTITEIAQYITFKLGEESFAINVAQVREVLEISQITKVPTAPAYMRGVVNVRGKAVPVVDLRTKFGLPMASDTPLEELLNALKANTIASAELVATYEAPTEQ